MQEARYTVGDECLSGYDINTELRFGPQLNLEVTRVRVPFF